jgi:protein-serine/threonine kinase
MGDSDTEPATLGFAARSGAAGPTLLLPGQVIDRFRLEEKLHTGGMAHIWRVSEVNHAGDSRLPLIMKVPRIKGGEDPATIVGFEVEQMIMPMLAGPHVPKFIAKGDFTRQPYIVMERIEGPSLKPRLDAAPLPLDEVIEIGSRVATALHDLHRQHLVHLDIKPSNIMFRPDGTAVLVDFGLSRHDHLPDLLDEEFMLPMGTGPYMSPEQVQFVRNDPRSDLFALGVMLYHLTTGERPFGSPESVRGLRRRLWLDPVPPRAIRADCPPWLQELILRCLEVKPERRHQSAAQLALDLQEPSQVALTKRAHKLQRSGAVKTFKRWFFALGAEPGEPRAKATEQLDRSPIVLAAVDVESGGDELLERLRESVRAGRAGRAPGLRQRDEDRAHRHGRARRRCRPEQAREAAGGAEALGAAAGPVAADRRWPAHLPRSGGAGSGAGHHRIRAAQPGRPRRDGRARQLRPAALPRQRVVRGGGGVRLHRHRGARAEPAGRIARPNTRPNKQPNNATEQPGRTAPPNNDRPTAVKGRRSAQFLAHDQLQPRPHRIHRAHLHVHPADRQSEFANHVLGDVGRPLRGLLGPRHPQHRIGRQLLAQARQLSGQLGALPDEEVHQADRHTRPLHAFQRLRRAGDQCVVIRGCVHHAQTQARLEPELLPQWRSAVPGWCGHGPSPTFLAMDDNPCTRCGACCASFRVDFASEELQSNNGCVPDGLAVPLLPGLHRMRGTDHARPRCAALVGTVGEKAHCGIYEWRPGPCREFGLRAPQGIGDEACARARKWHGLPPLPM